MSRPTQPPGRSVYEQLTSGVQLPLPPIPRFVLTVIVDAIAAARNRIPSDQIHTADEAALNAMMETQLNQVAAGHAAFRSVVAAVVRGKETIDFSGERLEKRPDLSMLLTSSVRERDFPLTVECKLICSETGKTVSLYCREGLKRYVDGDYGWARREGLMIAYVRDDARIDTHLTPYLVKHRDKSIDIFCTEVAPVHSAQSRDRAYSRHCRRFRYPGRAPSDDPGPIGLHHVWLVAAAHACQ